MSWEPKPANQPPISKGKLAPQPQVGVAVAIGESGKNDILYLLLYS